MRCGLGQRYRQLRRGRGAGIHHRLGGGRYAADGAGVGGTVGGGMAPAFVATPPPGPVGFAGLFSLPYPSTHSAAATGVRDAIDTWAKTGSATPSGGGSPVNWG